MRMPSPTPVHRPAGPEPTALKVTLFLVEPNRDLVAETPPQTVEAVLSRTMRSAERAPVLAPAFVLRSPSEGRGWKRLYRLARVLLSRLAAPHDLVLVLVTSSQVDPGFRAALFTLVSDLQITCGRRLSISVRFREPRSYQDLPPQCVMPQLSSVKDARGEPVERAVVGVTPAGATAIDDVSADVEHGHILCATGTRA